MKKCNKFYFQWAITERKICGEDSGYVHIIALFNQQVYK
jgi:hypothetical protein